MLRKVFANHQHGVIRNIFLRKRNEAFNNRPNYWPYIFPVNTFDDNSNPFLGPSNHVQQVRWKRRDGNSAFFQNRKSTRKKKKAYHRKRREVWQEKVGKHSAPGSTAGPRRQLDEERRQDYLNWDNITKENPEELEYDFSDAMLDDLIGNTAELSSTRTPEPIYLGHKHEFYYDRIANKTGLYNQLEFEDEISKESDHELIDSFELPTDHDISLVVRSFRDRYGTKHRPIGIAKALEHLLKDLKLQVASFGEKTYTSLLSCCSTPKEARRIFRLMQENHHEISEYSWSILVDIHAKLGDFQGCDDVMREMVISGGVNPTLPAYTSLLAGCFKAYNSGSSPRAIRIQAGELGWSKWKEMRILGIEADVMAYGAILHLCSARGQAERALNILEEMRIMEVKPTTLCFTAALKSIAKSHQIAIRFENGATKKNRKRQLVAAHHGNLAREVLSLAENAEVDLDDGFISALISCAGTAGDSASAKAILLASEIRRMDELRTIGSDEHLAQLRGRNTSKKTYKGNNRLSQRYLNGDLDAIDDIIENDRNDLLRVGAESSEADYRYPSYEEREYGKDSRVLSAMMQACSQAVNSNSLGDMWEGRENQGYLCLNSLRALKLRPEPDYMDNSIPGVKDEDIGFASLKWEKEEPEHLSKRLRRAKFEGIEVDESGTNLDDLDDDLYKLYEKDDPILNRRNPDAYEEKLPNDDPAWDISEHKKASTPWDEGNTPEPDEWYSDVDVNERNRKSSVLLDSESDLLDDYEDSSDQSKEIAQFNRYFGEDDATTTNKLSGGVNTGIEEDEDEMKWSNYPEIVGTDMPHNIQRDLTEQFSVGETIEIGKDQEELRPSSNLQETEYLEFVKELKQDMEDSGEVIDYSEEELREFYDMMYGDDAEEPDVERKLEVLEGLEEPEIGTGLHYSEDINQVDQEDFDNEFEEIEASLVPKEEGDLIDSTNEVNTYQNAKLMPADEEDYMMAELKALLPGMTNDRLLMVREAFKTTLGYPSILTLTPILRENMPERVTTAWLKRKNTQNAHFIVERAKEEGLMNNHLLNGMLMVETSTGSIDRALACHESRFRQYDIQPSEYSDRLIVEMLIKNNRASRALQFKEKVEGDSRHLDIISYGMLIDHYARHCHVGSALILLKECIVIHKAPPNERSLSALRRLCRQQEITRKTGLTELIGPDPLEWFRHGEANLKREYSKKGRRQILLPGNKALNI